MMGIRSWFLRPRSAEPALVVEPTDKAIEQAGEPPMQEDVKRAQHDFIQSIIALGRANAEARSLLARQTLLHVRGK